MHAGADWHDGAGQEGADRLSNGHAGERAKLKGTTRRFKARGLVVAPPVAIGDGALGFWKALDEAFPTTRHQRCWLHGWHRAGRASEAAMTTTFAEKYAPKYDKAVECLIKDRQTLLTFFDMGHLRTSNLIESVFGEASQRPREKRAVAGHLASHGVQTGDGRVQDVAAIARSKRVAESRQRYKVQGRNRSCRRNQIRRLIHAVTDFPTWLAERAKRSDLILTMERASDLLPPNPVMTALSPEWPELRGERAKAKVDRP